MSLPFETAIEPRAWSKFRVKDLAVTPSGKVITKRAPGILVHLLPLYVALKYLFHVA